MTDPSESQPQIRAEDVRRLCGDILDWKVGAILDSGASISDVELAVAQLTGADDILRDRPEALDGAAAVVYDLLMSGEDILDEDAPGGRS